MTFIETRTYTHTHPYCKNILRIANQMNPKANSDLYTKKKKVVMHIYSSNNIGERGEFIG